jgi:uncharacterized protein YpmB
LNCGEKIGQETQPQVTATTGQPIVVDNTQSAGINGIPQANPGMNPQNLGQPTVSGVQQPSMPVQQAGQQPIVVQPQQPIQTNQFTSPQPQPVMNGYTQPNPMQQASPTVKSKKNLIIILIVVLLVVIIGAIASYFVYQSTPSVKFKKSTVLLTGDGYSVRMFKGWSAENSKDALIVYNDSDNEKSEGVIVRVDKTSYDKAKTITENLAKISKSLGLNVSSLKESEEGKYKVIKLDGSGQVAGEQMQFISYTMFDKDTNKGGVIAVYTISDKVKKSIVDYHKNIFESTVWKSVDTTNSRSIEGADSQILNGFSQ